MIITHISDLHFGPQHRKESFAQVVKEINKLKPEAVVIAGDLTENGLLSEYKSAKQGIARFDCKIKVALAGNHDYKLRALRYQELMTKDATESLAVTPTLLL